MVDIPDLLKPLWLTSSSCKAFPYHSLEIFVLLANSMRLGKCSHLPFKFLLLSRDKLLILSVLVWNSPKQMKQRAAKVFPSQASETCQMCQSYEEVILTMYNFALQYTLFLRDSGLLWTRKKSEAILKGRYWANRQFAVFHFAAVATYS